MKSKGLPCIIAMTLLAVTMPGSLAAQDKAKQNHPHQYHHYQLNDVGTFGGPQSFQYLDGPAREVLNNSGALGGFADTSTIDPLCFFNPDCYAAHAFVWQNGAKTDLGLLPGGTNSQVNWIAASGLTAGVADNGQVDPLLGVPQTRGTFWGHDGVITDVGALPGTYFAFAYAVNNRGQVVGQALNTIPDPYSIYGQGYQARAFLWDNKKGMQDLGTLGGTDAIGAAINDQGQVLGWSYINSVPSPICAHYSYPASAVLSTNSFIWDKKNGMRDLGGLGGTCTLASDLNNHGQIVGGSALTGDTQVHPFVWNAVTGVTDLLGPSDSNYGWAGGENSHGDVAGGTCDSVTCYALLWRKSGRHWHKTILSTVTDNAFSISINASEQVVGSFDVGTNSSAPFLWENGGPIVDLNTLVPPNSGLQFLEVGQINDRGEISVNASDASGNNHTVVLMPCDENHPGIEGCDYSLVDAEAVAPVQAPQIARAPSGALRNGITSASWGRLRTRTARR